MKIESWQDSNMRNDTDKIRSEYFSVVGILENELRSNLDDEIKQKLISRISFRIKEWDSFITKALKTKKSNEGKVELKYKQPLLEIQDLIGIRIVVYYKSYVDIIANKLKKIYNSIETKTVEPDSAKKFDYIGLHLIMPYPTNLNSEIRKHKNICQWFEIQVLTLMQDAYAVGEHKLGYKPQTELTLDVEKSLAFVAAQCWGADEILDQLNKGKIK